VIRSTGAGTELPLSAAQLGLWFAQQLDPRNAAFNVGEYLEILGPIATHVEEWQRSFHGRNYNLRQLLPALDKADAQQLGLENDLARRVTAPSWQGVRATLAVIAVSVLRFRSALLRSSAV
jgi:hypothetical protein